MNRLLVIPIILTLANGLPARVPKIYNALITTDENLQPSQAYPLIEPVLRTTALGVAYPPLLIRPSPPPQPQSPPQNNQQQQSNEKQQSPQLSYHSPGLYPLAYDPYLSYGYHHDLIYPPLPYYQQPFYVDLAYAGNQGNNAPPPSSSGEAKQVQPLPPQMEQLPPQHAINFKKNPDIPDVIPPLPVTRNERKRRS